MLPFTSHTHSCFLAPAFSFLTISQKTGLVNAGSALLTSPHHHPPRLFAFIFISFPSPRSPLSWKNSWTGLSICHWGLQPASSFLSSSTSLALSWTSVYVCQNTDSPSPCSESIRSHLYCKQSSRFILPITSEHLLFKFQIAFFLGVNSVPAILGSLLTTAPTQHLIVMLVESYIHTQMCVHTQPHEKHTVVFFPPDSAMIFRVDEPISLGCMSGLLSEMLPCFLRPSELLGNEEKYRSI